MRSSCVSHHGLSAISPNPFSRLEALDGTLFQCRESRRPRREALQLAAVLAVGGEFAFVVFSEAVKAGLLDDVMRDRLVAAVGVSMALTPLLMIAIARFLRGHPVARPARDYDPMPDDGHPQVLIAGFGRFGQIVARLLVAQKVPFIAIEHSADQVDFMRRFGNPLFYGDPTGWNGYVGSAFGTSNFVKGQIDEVRDALKKSDVQIDSDRE